MCIYLIFIHSSVDGHVICFHILAVANNAAVNTEAHKSFQISAFIFFRKIPGSGTAGPYGNSIFTFFEDSPSCFP